MGGSKELITLFVDFQNSDTEGKIRLNTVGTFRDIKANHVNLKVGMKFLLDDGEDLKTIGTVEFSENENIWVAKIDWDDL